MNTKIKYILAILFSTCILNNSGWAQNPLFINHYLPSLGDNRLILTPDLAKASLNRGQVTIPFTVKNNSDRELELLMGQIAGLAVDQAGKKIFIQDFSSGQEETSYIGGGPSAQIILLEPGQTSSSFNSVYATQYLSAVTGRQIFGVIGGRIVSANKGFISYSVPFLIPPELMTLPFNDLGAQNYLSITPDLTKVSFTGGDFKVTTLELQRADPHYADSIKNGWTENVWVPITITNTSNRDLIVANDVIRFYIDGKMSKKNDILQYVRLEYLKTSTPIVKPGESCGITGRDYITLRFLEDDGYKPGNKIIAMVGGRIPGTNQIFECCSAPFELPPLPKGEPPAGK